MAQSSAPSERDAPTVQWNELPERAMDHLVNEYGEEQESRVVGCFPSQSLRRVLMSVDADDIIRLKGKRRVVSEGSEEWARENLTGFGTPGFRSYSKHETECREKFQINYDRRATHAPFDADGELDYLDSEDELHDVAVNKLVIRFESDALHDQLSELLREVAQFKDIGEFEQPFHAEMRSRGAGSGGIRRAVRQRHHDNYFLKHRSAASDGGDPPAMGWSPRTLDLTALWSHNAWGDSSEVVGRKGTGENVTMAGLEGQVFNDIAADEPRYGAISSRLVVNKWNTAFDHDATDIKHWMWDENGGWVQAGGRR